MLRHVIKSAPLLWIKRIKILYKKMAAFNIIEKLSDPNYEGNLGLPLNPIPLQVAKYNICQTILHYKFDNEISTEKLAKLEVLSWRGRKTYNSVDAEALTLRFLLANCY